MTLSSRSGCSLRPRACSTAPSCRSPRRTGVSVAPVAVSRRHDAPARVDVAVAVGQPQQQLERRVAERVGKHGAGLLGRRAPGAQVDEMALDEPQALVARAVEAAVDDALHTRAQRPERERDGERRGGGRQRRAGAQRDAERQRHGGVRRGEQRRQRHVDERAVDEPVDLVEAVAHDRDADRERDRDEHDDERPPSPRRPAAGDQALGPADLRSPAGSAPRRTRAA